MPSLPTTGV